MSEAVIVITLKIQISSSESRVRKKIVHRKNSRVAGRRNRVAVSLSCRGKESVESWVSCAVSRERKCQVAGKLCHVAGREVSSRRMEIIESREGSDKRGGSALFILWRTTRSMGSAHTKGSVGRRQRAVRSCRVTHG
ncbi:unnamed protein product [Arabis nemorensis]|uniref:Uncharacterized protein n=1 Tax=Arabis nemorensis TaxID=586526 RepID=A0A565BEH4_9BRAS|nr:unnamed protein product [Arabis nemorensis]